jgi:hypothetical protein
LVACIRAKSLASNAAYALFDETVGCGALTMLLRGGSGVGDGLGVAEGAGDAVANGATDGVTVALIEGATLRAALPPQPTKSDAESVAASMEPATRLVIFVSLSPTDLHGCEGV